MNMTDPIKAASERFAQGHNCAQAVFAAFAARSGLSEEIALKIASPLGGGVARQGLVCGAVTGALMALGLERGSDAPQDKEETYQIAEEFVARFKEIHQKITCCELIGYDISTKEGFLAARDSGVFKEVCPLLVKDAAQLLMEFLQPPGNRQS